MHSNIWYGTSGPRNARIVIVGEAWGREEVLASQPFVGQSGRELFRILGEALKMELPLLNAALAQRSQAQWISMRNQWLTKCGILLANVVAAQPPSNDFTHFLIDTKSAKAQKAQDFHGTYPRDILWHGLANLRALLDAVRPNIVVAVGNWALFSLTSHTSAETTAGYKLPTGITNWRGSQTYYDPNRLNHPRTRQPRNAGDDETPPPTPLEATPLGAIPLLPIIHPAAILRDWGQRHLTVHDLRSRLGRYLSGHLKWDAPSYNDCWRPTLGDVRTSLGAWRASLDRGDEVWLSVDLETYARRFITCTGICDGDLALCIPWFYFNERQQSIPYWTIEEELSIIDSLREILEHENVRIIGQNFMYDTQYFHRCHCIAARVSGDTEIAHHVLYPGTPKTLEMLASLYNHHYIYWKDESEEWAADSVSAEDLWRYNCIDTRRTYEAWGVLRQALASEGAEGLYVDRMDQWELARHMTLQGVPQDQALRERFTRELYRELAPLEAWLEDAIPTAWRHTAAGRPWFTSSQAVAQLLYTCIGLTPILHKKTKRPTTDDTAILELCERKDTQWLSPLLERLRDWRSAQVFKNNFLEIGLDPSGRWPMQVKIAQPETFRWSTGKNAFDEGSNMQNLPKVED